MKPFVAVDDEAIIAGDLHASETLRPSLMAVPRHILELRRIASKIARTVYSSANAGHLGTREGEAIVNELHKELIDWRRGMPFPLPDVHTQVPQLSSTWYDFNFYTHLAMLYRPSALLPTMDERRVKILADAAAMSIRHAINMHRQHRLAYNWLNLLAIYTAALSLIYAVTAQPNNLVDVLRESKAIEDLESAVDLFELLTLKFPGAKKIHHMVQEVVLRYKGIIALG